MSDADQSGSGISIPGSDPILDELIRKASKPFPYYISPRVVEAWRQGYWSPNQIEAKRCRGCGEYKPIYAFYTYYHNIARQRYVRSVCKACSLAQINAYRAGKKWHPVQLVKVCADCLEEKPVEQFTKAYDNRRKKSYYRGVCKQCYSGVSTAYATGEKKACTICGVTKSIGAFPRESRVKSGRAARCTLCNRAHSKQYQEGKKRENLEAQQRALQPGKHRPHHPRGDRRSPAVDGVRKRRSKTVPHSTDHPDS